MVAPALEKRRSLGEACASLSPFTSRSVVIVKVELLLMSGNLERDTASDVFHPERCCCCYCHLVCEQHDNEQDLHEKLKMNVRDKVFCIGPDVLLH